MKESQHTELKSSFNDEVIETLVAFANTNGGKVLVGVRNNGLPLTSFTIGEETIQKYINEIKNKTQPSIIPNVRIKNIKGTDVLEFIIPEFPVKPVAFKGRYFKRVKNSNHQLTPIEISDLSLQSLQLSWDSYPAFNSTIADIDLSKVEKFILKINTSGRFKLSGIVEDNLKKLKLINNEGKITNAALLLFSKEDISYNIHLGRFKTPEMIIDDKMLRMSLFDAVEATMKFLISQIKVAFEIEGYPTRRTEILSIPSPLCAKQC
jgi:ATP-dependent DNA helicase RecG